MIRVGVIEDDPVTLEEIVDVLGTSERMECVMSASSAEQFLKYFSAEARIDIILVDASRLAIGIE